MEMQPNALSRKINVSLERGIFARDRKSIDGKIRQYGKRQLYTTFKTAPTEEEREKARQEYLDKCGMWQEELIIFPIRKDRNISMRPIRREEQHRSSGKILQEKIS